MPDSQGARIASKLSTSVVKLASPVVFVITASVKSRTD
jgi:hypothetical protein